MKILICAFVLPILSELSYFVPENGYITILDERDLSKLARVQMWMENIYQSLFSSEVPHGGRCGKNISDKEEEQGDARFFQPVQESRSSKPSNVSRAFLRLAHLLRLCNTRPHDLTRKEKHCMMVRLANQQREGVKTEMSFTVTRSEVLEFIPRIFAFSFILLLSTVLLHGYYEDDECVCVYNDFM